MNPMILRVVGRMIGRMNRKTFLLLDLKFLDLTFRLFRSQTGMLQLCPVFTSYHTYFGGKELARFIDKDGKVLSLFLQLVAHNQVFILFLRGVYFNNSL